MKVGELLYFQFTVFDTDGLTPLTGQAGSVTSVLRFNNTVSGVSVTVAEIGSTGSYTASFTPDAAGEWDVEVTSPDDRVVGLQYIVEVADKDDIKAETALIVEDTGTTLPAILATMDGKIDAIDTVVDAIQLVTDLLPDAGALTSLISLLDEILDLLENQLIVDDTLNTLNLYNDAGDTIVKTWPLKDKDGNDIILTGTGPAQRILKTLG